MEELKLLSLLVRKGTPQETGAFFKETIFGTAEVLCFIKR